MATLADDVRDRAFERLYEGHVRDVYRYVLAVLRNPADAEDVTQTTFMNAYRAFKAGERPRKPQNWLITIAHNACRTRAVRASRRPREVPLDDVVEQLAVPEQEKPNVRELLRALGRLPFNQRAAITMRELEGRSYEEIAETLEVSVPAVEALIVRARRTMRLQSSALRGLMVVQLPRSLRGMFETGDVATAGGALIGGGVLVKAAAVVLAGVVAGGVGKAVEAGVTHRGHTAPRLEPRAHTSPPAVSNGVLGATTIVHRLDVHTASRRARPMPRPGAPASTPEPVISIVAPGGATSSTVPEGLPVAPPVAAPATPATPSAVPGARVDPGPVSRPVSTTVSALLPAPRPLPAPLPPAPVPPAPLPSAPVPPLQAPPGSPAPATPDLPPVQLPVSPPAAAPPVATPGAPPVPAPPLP